MHILEIPSFFIPHGGEFCLEQARALQQRGHQVRVLSCCELAVTLDRAAYLTAPHGRRWETLDGVECYRTFMCAVPRAVRYNEQRWVRSVMSMYGDYVRRYGRPDVLHAHCIKWAGVAALEIARREGIPCYVTEHLSSVLFRKDFGADWSRCRWAQGLIRRTMESVTCVIPVSAELVADLHPFFGSNYRYHVISNIVDVEHFGLGLTPEQIVARRRAQRQEQRPRRLVCLARAEVVDKGYDVLAQAVAGGWLRAHRVELHIAGRGTEGLRGLFPDGEVILHGNLDKGAVRDLLWQCDALVMPSRCESQCLVVLEALASGVPVVATEAVPANARIEGGCIMVPIGEAEPLRGAMERVLPLSLDAGCIGQLRRMVAPESVAAQLEQLFAEGQRDAP